MMRKTFAAVLAVAVLAAIASGSGFDFIQPTGDQFGEIAETYTTARRTTDNNIPIIAIRFDDGRDDLVSLSPGVTDPADPGFYGSYWPFLKEGIPVGLALNYDFLGNANRATVADIQRIMAEFDSAGVAIEIGSHFDSGLTSASTMTWAQLQDEVDPAELEAAFGQDVTWMAQPGDNAPKAFARRHHAVLADLMADYGILYWDSVFGAADSIPTVGWAVHSSFDGLTSPQLLLDLSDRMLFPGVTDDPYRLPATKTIDLGAFVVERPASAAYDSFTILGQGTGDPVANWESSFTVLYSLMIANGWGGVLTIHDSLSSDAAGDVGQFSPHRVAEVLADLRDAGFIRLGTPSEAYEWALSRWAPGSCVMQSTMRYPNYTIGDSVGVEVAWLDQLGSFGIANANWVGSGVNSNGSITAGTNAKFDRTGVYPTDLVTTAANGYKGGNASFEMNATQNRFRFAKVGLPLGRYELSLATSATSTDIRDWNIAAVGKYQRPGYSLTATYPSWGDTLLMLYDGGVAAAGTNHTSGAIAHNLIFPFQVSEWDIVQRLANDAAVTGLGWTQDAPQTNRFGSYWMSNWEGGVFMEFEPGSSPTHFSRVRLKYLGK